MELMNAWASTLPGTKGDLPRPGQPCAVDDCPERLKTDEECYRVVELASNEWICWRHIARESGPPHPVTTDE